MNFFGLSRARLVLLAGIGIVVLIGALIVWGVTRHSPNESVSDSSRPPGTAKTLSELDNMGGMRGMNMSSNGNVQLTANQLRQFGVTFGTVEERTLENTVRAVGTVTVDETSLSEVTPRFGGYVERLYVDATGQRVRQGQPLMDVYSPELLAAEQELLVAAKLQESIGESSVPGVPAPSTDLVAAARRRFALWGISDAQVDEILRSGKLQRALTLYAPASGIVLEKDVVQGQAVQPGETLYRIANLGTVWIDVALREQDAGSIREGSNAIVELASYPGRPVDGRVAYVYPTLDRAARTVHARIEVPNHDGRLKPGMYATVTLTTPARRALTAPTSAVLNTGERTLVFMDIGGGRLMPTDVVTGRTSGGYTEVLSGLEAGQRVVTSAQYLLDSESNLAEVMRSMLGQLNMSDMSDVGGMNDMPGMNDKGADMNEMKMRPAVPPDTSSTTLRDTGTMRGMKLSPAPINPRR